MFNFSTVEGAQCYVCSWSPSDTYRADLCTRGNFSDSVRTTKCEHGCESVTVFDKNGMWTTSVGCVTRSSIVFEPGEMTQFYKGETPNHLVRLGLEPKPKRQFASSLTRRKIGSPHPVRKQIRSPCPAINTVNATTGFHINSPPPLAQAKWTSSPAIAFRRPPLRSKALRPTITTTNKADRAGTRRLRRSVKRSVCATVITAMEPLYRPRISL